MKTLYSNSRGSSKIIIASFCLVAGGFLSYFFIKKLKKTVKEMEEERQKKIEELEEIKENFRIRKDSVMEYYNDEWLSGLTLGNYNIKNAEDKAYLYNKLNSLSVKIYNCSYNETKEFDDLVYNLKNLCYSLEKLDEEAIEAKLLYLRKKDEEDSKIQEKINIAREKQREHERELEKMREKRKSDLDIYNAKLCVEKAKLETLAKAMSGAGNKNISSSINIKTDLKED